jgi:tRNA modification GTPase
MDILKHWLQHHAGRQTHPEGLFSARRRHLDALANAGEHLALAMQLLNQEASGDLVAEELRLGQHALEHITGRIIPDNILGDIFSSFCIGK